MDSRRTPDISRWYLGLMAAVFFGIGLLLTFRSDPGPDELAWGGVLVRSGLILGALWLVLPNARRVRPATWWAIGIAAAVLVFRPRLILWGLLAAVVIVVVGWASRRT